MSYLYLIEKSMTKYFNPGSTFSIIGCFTNKKAAIEALKSLWIFDKKDNIETFRTYVHWRSSKQSWVERYYRIIKVESNKLQEPFLFDVVKGEEVVIFPNLKY